MGVFGGKGVRGRWVFIGGVWKRNDLANATNLEIFRKQVRYVKNSVLPGGRSDLGGDGHMGRSWDLAGWAMLGCGA